MRGKKHTEIRKSIDNHTTRDNWVARKRGGNGVRNDWRDGPLNQRMWGACACYADEIKSTKIKAKYLLKLSTPHEQGEMKKEFKCGLPKSHPQTCESSKKKNAVSRDR